MTSEITFPATPLLRHFRELPKGRGWQEARLKKLDEWLAKPRGLAESFGQSVRLIERGFSSPQPFYPEAHRFGAKPNGIAHGEKLTATVDVAQRLSKRAAWVVRGDSRLGFSYLDRELELGRAKPGTRYPAEGNLLLDLFLVNSTDRTPILGELKIRTDQDPSYALLQLLCLATYAVTESQRARLCLWGSRPERVLTEEVPGKPIPPIDLYLLSLDAPTDRKYPLLSSKAKALSEKLVAQPEIAAYVRRIAWLRIEESGRSLVVDVDAIFERPRRGGRTREELKAS